MSRSPGFTCASCRRFPIHEAVANGGAALCAGYERIQHFSDSFCVLYLRASDVEQRKRLVEQLREADNKERKNDE